LSEVIVLRDEDELVLPRVFPDLKIGCFVESDVTNVVAPREDEFEVADQTR
jgi:hypothetical protein